MKMRSYFCQAAGLMIVGMILAVVSPGCSRSPTVNPDDVWPKVFTMASGMYPLSEPGTESDSDRVHMCKGQDEIVGYAVEKEVVSRSGPFRIMVFINTEVKVKRVIILHYPYARGRKVQKPQFRRQFEGKGPGDPIRLGEDIDAVTGATISSRAITTGVKESVQMIQSITEKTKEKYMKE